VVAESNPENAVCPNQVSGYFSIYPLAFGGRIVSCCCYGKQKCTKARSKETEKKEGITNQNFIHTGASEVAPVVF
jgi:hypothetical protein